MDAWKCDFFHSQAHWFWNCNKIRNYRNDLLLSVCFVDPSELVRSVVFVTVIFAVEVVINLNKN